MPTFSSQTINAEDLNHAQTKITAKVITEIISAADTDDKTAGDTNYAA
jgi:hypothetical protein